MNKSVNSIEKILERQRRKHIFGRFRRQLRFIVAPFYLIFGAIDWLYKPEHFFFWLSLRVAFILSIWISFSLLKTKKIRDKYSQLIAVANLSLACWIIDIMIAQSGGHKSIYVTGLILVTITGIQLMRLNRKSAILSSIFSYIPAIAVIFYHAFPTEITLGLVQIGFLLGMIFLSYIFRSSDDLAERVLTKGRFVREQEITRLKRTELLNRNFPTKLREQIENGEESLPPKRIHSTAVVGFADITGSTAITNTVGLLRDWEIKEKFLEAAHKRATECGLIVLTHLGDGFMFLANYYENSDWTLNLISFYDALLRDFEDLRSSVMGDIGTLETGLKCGVAIGPAIIGFIGSDQSYFTAMGPDVNLASRLCGRARNYEMVVSSRVWSVLRHTLFGWEFQEVKYDDIKGFSGTIPAVHIRPRKLSANRTACPTCGAVLTVLRTEEGFIDMSCPNGHLGENAASPVQILKKIS